MSLGAIFSLMLSAVLIENYTFVRFLGICPFLGVSDRSGTGAGLGCAVVFVMTLSSALTYVIYHFVLVPLQLEYLQTIAFILIIAALVQLIEMLLKRSAPALYQALGIYLPLITTNCAVLGAALQNVTNEYNFMQSVLYGCFSALGFTLAILLFAGVRMRLKRAQPPKAFEGMPIVLVTAGLVAMAFAGFSGISI